MSKQQLTPSEQKALRKVICKALKDETYNTSTKDDLFMAMKIICDNEDRADVSLIEINRYL